MRRQEPFYRASWSRGEPQGAAVQPCKIVGEPGLARGSGVVAGTHAPPRWAVLNFPPGRPPRRTSWHPDRPLRYQEGRTVLGTSWPAYSARVSTTNGYPVRGGGTPGPEFPEFRAALLVPRTGVKLLDLSSRSSEPPWLPRQAGWNSAARVHLRLRYRQGGWNSAARVHLRPWPRQRGWNSAARVPRVPRAERPEW